MIPDLNGFALPPLPPATELETTPVLRKLAAAHRYLAELKGMVASIPNENILINTLTLQEAKDSSAVENIITTHDELYRGSLFNDARNPAAKEVGAYAQALRAGFALVRQDGLITVNRLIDLQQVLEHNDAGLRRQPGTVLRNERTGEVVYTPPQAYDTIIALLQNLERFINDAAMLDVDPLIKMAVIHYQFESIHPFYDGNGRTGRILNILYLVAQGLLDIPVLYLSRHIIQNKNEYYRLLQAVRESGAWEDWCLYMLTGVETTSRETLRLVLGIKTLMQDYEQRIKSALPKIYSQDLLNNLFHHPYTKIDHLQKELGVSRLTATKYLEQLTAAGFVQKRRLGKYNYYINEPLFRLFAT